MDYLNNKTVLITGATSGIGLQIAKIFAKQGAKIIFNGLDNVENAISELSAITTDILYSASNLEHSEQIQNMVTQGVKKFNTIDILINNAGIQYIAPIHEFSLEMWNKIIAINLTASFELIRLCLPYMQKNHWGRIVNIASVHGLVASLNKSAYVAAKHGLIGLTKVCALENALKNITCNCICPGWVQTPLVDKQIQAKAQTLNIDFEEAKKILLSEKQPSQDFVQAQDIANLALFLCGEQAKQVNGASWNIDGGWLAQ